MRSILSLFTFFSPNKLRKSKFTGILVPSGYLSIDAMWWDVIQFDLVTWKRWLTNYLINCYNDFNLWLLCDCTLPRVSPIWMHERIDSSAARAIDFWIIHQVVSFVILNSEPRIRWSLLMLKFYFWFNNKESICLRLMFKIQFKWFTREEKEFDNNSQYPIPSSCSHCNRFQ